LEVLSKEEIGEPVAQGGADRHEDEAAKETPPKFGSAMAPVDFDWDISQPMGIVFHWGWGPEACRLRRRRAHSL
jgi:hypothetical protein